jgi:hypothetical protein
MRRIRISADLILTAGLAAGYVAVVLGTQGQAPVAVGIGAAAILLCAVVLAAR